MLQTVGIRRQHEAKKTGEMMIGGVVWRVELPLENEGNTVL